MVRTIILLLFFSSVAMAQDGDPNDAEKKYRAYESSLVGAASVTISSSIKAGDTEKFTTDCAIGKGNLFRLIRNAKVGESNHRTEYLSDGAEIFMSDRPDQTTFKPCKEMTKETAETLAAGGSMLWAGFRPICSGDYGLTVSGFSVGKDGSIEYDVVITAGEGSPGFQGKAVLWLSDKNTAVKQTLTGKRESPPEEFTWTETFSKFEVSDKVDKADFAIWTTTATGLQYRDLQVGEGGSPGATDPVEVHYTGWLMDGKKFDSSRDRGKPLTFRLNQVIKGWTEGLQTMKEGGRRILQIPPGLAYGKTGAGGVIPPDATLRFDVELLKIKK
jgi:FKBP-type peptidyl-prolyl cis-trans isomerase